MKERGSDGQELQQLRKDLKHAESRIQYLSSCLAHLSEPLPSPAPVPATPPSRPLPEPVPRPAPLAPHTPVPAPMHPSTPEVHQVVPRPMEPQPLLNLDDPLPGFRLFLERSYHDLEAAFYAIDINRSGQISLSEMIQGLQPLGFDREMAKGLFYAIVPSKHHRRGYLSKQDWMKAFAHKGDAAEVLSFQVPTRPGGTGQVAMLSPEPSDAPTLARVNVAPVLQTLHTEAAELGGTGGGLLSHFREIVIRRFGTVESAFQKIDRNNSGQITVHELLKALGDEVDREMANAVFKEVVPSSVDPSIVRREDWSRALRRGGSSRSPQRTPRGSADQPSQERRSNADVLLGMRVLLVERYGDLTKSFEALDRNRSGQLSAIEFAAGLNRLGVDRVTAQKAFNELSQGKTNALTLQEWLVGFDRSRSAAGL